jgi:hypothetical protein
LNGGQRQAFLFARIVDGLALIVEDHGGPLIDGESRPIRQTFVVRIPVRAKATQAAA